MFVLFLYIILFLKNDKSNQILYTHSIYWTLLFLFCIIILGSLLSFNRCTPRSLSFILYCWLILSLSFLRRRRIIIHSHHSKLSTPCILFISLLYASVLTIILYKMLLLLLAFSQFFIFYFYSLFFFALFPLWAIPV